VLQLVADSWKDIGIKLYTKPSQREVFRNRIYAGDTHMSVWSGLENALPNPDMSPVELAPLNQVNLQWPKWGQYYQTKGRSGEPVDMPLPEELVELFHAWERATDHAERERIWQRMLEIHADEVTSIGLIQSIPQPIVVSNRLHNVPEEAVYSWDPSAHFGRYRMDTFWVDQ